MQALVIELINRSVSAGWIVLAALLLRAVFFRAPKAVRGLLWIPVGIRLILPVTVESAWSLLPSPETVSPAILTGEPSIHTGVNVFNSAVNPALTEMAGRGAGAEGLQIALTVFSALWLAGTAVILLYGAVSYLLLKKKLISAVRLRENIWQTEAAPGPFVLGLIRPRIYVPFGMAGDDLAFAAAHEQAHIRRGDHWVKPIAYLILAAYWMNPLLWLAYSLLCRDMELEADERAVHGMNMAGKKAYAGALVAANVSRRAVSACPLAFGGSDIGTRVRNILHHKKPAFWSLLAGGAACAALAVCFLTNPVEPAVTAPVESGGGETVDCVFADVVYMNMLSSYYPFGGTGYLYRFGESSFSIVNETTGEAVRTFSGLDWDWQPLTQETWEAMFSEGLGKADITQYADRKMITLSSDYRLFKMDGEIWLMQISDNGFVWSIYELAQAGSRALTLQDVLRLSAFGEGLTWDQLKPYAFEDIGSGRYIYVFPIGEGWELILNSGSGFVSGEAIQEPVVLTYLPDGESVDIRSGGVAEFIARKESARTGCPMVCSGGTLCSAVEVNSGADRRAIVFDPTHREKYGVPFTLFFLGDEIYGAWYSIRDAETGKELEFIFPSGLAAQTYILQNAVSGRSYEVRFQGLSGYAETEFFFDIYVP